MSRFVFRTCFGMIIYVRARGHCERSCRSGSPLHRAGRHTVPGPTRAFVRTAHNHTLACVYLGGVMQIDATPLLQDRTKLLVPIFRDVGVLLFCQPSIRHQSMSNAFFLVCCACTLSACSPLLALRARHLPAL